MRFGVVVDCGVTTLAVEHLTQRQSSPVLVGIQLKSLGPFLKPSDQLRYGIAFPLPGRPKSNFSARHLATALPTALWPVWSLRFAMPNCDQRQLRMALSAVILLVHRRITLTECADLIDSPLTGGAVSRILQLLQRQEQWHEIREALMKMATYLEEHGAPIDYQRRRFLDYTNLLPNGVWAQICRDTGSPGAGRVRARVARCFLYERLSGMQADAAPFADSTTHFRRATANFAGSMTKDLAGALYEYAQDFLDGQNVRGEPATWQPQENLLQDMRLPGYDPARGNTASLGHITAGNMRVGKISNELRVSVDAARYLAEMNPAEPPGWASGSAPRPPRLGAYRAAKMALPAERMRDLYNDRRMSLADIAAEVGVSKPVVGRLAREYGLQVATPGPKVKHIFDQDWLFEQYLNRKRSLPEIAAEVGVGTATVARWASENSFARLDTSSFKAAAFAISSSAISVYFMPISVAPLCDIGEHLPIRFHQRHSTSMSPGTLRLGVGAQRYRRNGERGTRAGCQTTR